MKNFMCVTIATCFGDLNHFNRCRYWQKKHVSIFLNLCWMQFDSCPIDIHIYFQCCFTIHDRILMDNLSQWVPMYENVGTVVYDEPFPQQSTSKFSLLIAHVCSYPVATATYATFVVTSIWFSLFLPQHLRYFVELRIPHVCLFPLEIQSKTSSGTSFWLSSLLPQFQRFNHELLRYFWERFWT